MLRTALSEVEAPKVAEIRPNEGVVTGFTQSPLKSEAQMDAAISASSVADLVVPSIPEA